MQTDTPIYEQVAKDLKIVPTAQQGHDRRVRAIVHRHRSKLQGKHTAQPAKA